jgi:hypothetical protein
MICVIQLWVFLESGDAQPRTFFSSFCFRRVGDLRRSVVCSVTSASRSGKSHHVSLEQRLLSVTFSALRSITLAAFRFITLVASRLITIVVLRLITGIAQRPITQLHFAVSSTCTMAQSSAAHSTVFSMQQL